MCGWVSFCVRLCLSSGEYQLSSTVYSKKNKWLKHYNNADNKLFYNIIIHVTNQLKSYCYFTKYSFKINYNNTTFAVKSRLCNIYDQCLPFASEVQWQYSQYYEPKLRCPQMFETAGPTCSSFRLPVQMSGRALIPVLVYLSRKGFNSRIGLFVSLFLFIFAPPIRLISLT